VIETHLAQTKRDLQGKLFGGAATTTAAKGSVSRKSFTEEGSFYIH